MDFAKIFKGGKDQILVKVDSNEEGSPEVRLFFGIDGFGICSNAFEYEDSDKGWEKADETFAKIDELKAESIVNQARQLIHGSDSDDPK